ncbi:hypothetical protein [Thalassotalea eurytherma]|uniref:Uncharacterized protein n=1 Tax=Thalassotalea eurytherma TaxID=1144278 RepID=A0ABQ6HAE2_9GAMM|nr:hypothetical protein [Thalassotalea eurytherma]GLX83740.1 hypothetical protein theurythT_31930 [Thalassotalea eurytherma]
MNSNKGLISQLVISSILLVVFAAVLVWVPYFAENKATLKKPLDERIAIIQKAIERTSTETNIDKDVNINIFQMQIESEQANDDALRSVINVYKPLSKVLVGLLLIHIVVVFHISRRLGAKKT